MSRCRVADLMAGCGHAPAIITRHRRRHAVNTSRYAIAPYAHASAFVAAIHGFCYGRGIGGRLCRGVDAVTQCRAAADRTRVPGAISTETFSIVSSRGISRQGSVSLAAAMHESHDTATDDACVALLFWSTARRLFHGLALCLMT
jgi:hypothetical protein